MPTVFRFCILYILLFISSTLSVEASSFNALDSTKFEKTERTQDPPKTKKNNKLAKWSLIMSGAGFLFTFLPFISVLSPFLLVGGVVTGIISLGQIKKRKQKGSGLAIAGLIIGGVSILAAVLVIALLFSAFN